MARFQISHPAPVGGFFIALEAYFALLLCGMPARFLIYALLIVALLLGGFFFVLKLNLKTMKKIYYFTSDQVKIVGNYWRGTKNRAIVLLHMMPATKESWNTFAEKLNERGWHVLAIDLRGHGESLQSAFGKQLNFRNFSNRQHQASIKDVEGAVLWLKERGIHPNEVVIGGASIGANLTIEYMAEHPEIRKGLALSPGLNFRGIEADALMLKLREQQSIYLVAAKDDPYSNRSIVQLARMGSAKKLVKNYDSGGHGTILFQTHPSLLKILVDWL